jgi:hypothetical protein
MSEDEEYARYEDEQHWPPPWRCDECRQEHGAIIYEGNRCAECMCELYRKEAEERDRRIASLESTNARLVEERDALHKALDLVLMLTYRDVRELNAYGTAIKALLPGYRAGLGITVAFADDVKKALASAGERRDG